ncbi:hypothetical protein WJX73_008404 [Symbiochloris irregularis]|uniref:C2 NT-type domain-containing protein n=1 Tax=Symbiochloris irregularis TaxID=706552 RepID=A0AAW1PDX4_9CHLO
MRTAAGFDRFRVASYVFEEGFSFPCTLRVSQESTQGLQPMTEWGTQEQPEYEQKWLHLKVLSCSDAPSGRRKTKDRQLAELQINLADFVQQETGRASVARTVACDKAISAAVGTPPKLHFTIGCHRSDRSPINTTSLPMTPRNSFEINNAALLDAALKGAAMLRGDIGTAALPFQITATSQQEQEFTFPNLIIATVGDVFETSGDLEIAKGAEHITALWPTQAGHSMLTKCSMNESSMQEDRLFDEWGHHSAPKPSTMTGSSKSVPSSRPNSPSPFAASSIQQSSPFAAASVQASSPFAAADVQALSPFAAANVQYMVVDSW